MNEDFLHYLWRFSKVNIHDLRTACGKELEILFVGIENQNSGPDFLNTKIRIAGKIEEGKVEIHKKSSDWYAHNHELDDNYSDVILHVVWENDVEVFSRFNVIIPTLELKGRISTKLEKNYYDLFSKNKRFILCEERLENVDRLVINHWLERLFIERLEDHTKKIEKILKATENDWEAALYHQLSYGFGLKINSQSFYQLSELVPFRVIRKCQTVLQIEALFYGVLGLLNEDCEDIYFNNLRKEFSFLSKKFDIKIKPITPVKFYKLRPYSFPTIRLSQLANLYFSKKGLFSQLMKCSKKEDVYDIFMVQASSYWLDHFTFGKTSKKSIKRLNTSFVDVLIINVILPFMYCFLTQKRSLNEDFYFSFIKEIPREKNVITTSFDKIHLVSKTAFGSQALIQLYNNYCQPKRCMRCSIGNALLRS